ncbi:hypothetical protein P872_16685 [Rhodonellum psychrophilum GCM71 = DSM 17998]|uniref:Exostosin GT47 domain-containing protein n=3 Tax=Cytophagaceae TaxID=89373 RepID=U5BRV3_9BACT|nr:hypothetical protein P872_16685 [Rhodonellum psychrophilum GCM71 = DSM 17998]
MNLKNVYYDKNSVFQFSELNESQYLLKLFQNFEKISDGILENYEFYIFANDDEKILPDCLNHLSQKKIILYYLADAGGSIDPRPISSNFELIFKTHLEEAFISDNVLPISLGYVNDVPELPVKPIHDRNYNVFFRGDLNRNRFDLYRSFFSQKKFFPRRGLPTTIFRDMAIGFKNDFSNYFPDSLIIFNKGFNTGFSAQEFGKVLADSKIILSPMGFGNAECFRDFEGMRAGCVIISDKLPKTEFYDGSPIIQVENWKEGLLWAKKLIDDSEMLMDYHLKTVDWWNNKCSEKAVAIYMKDKILLNSDNKKIIGTVLSEE